MESVIEFKREVYRLALNELAAHLGGDTRKKSRTHGSSISAS